MGRSSMDFQYRAVNLVSNSQGAGRHHTSSLRRTLLVRIPGSITSHSLTSSRFVSIPNKDDPTSISQALSGFDTTQQYTLTYYWGLTTKQEIYDSRCHVKVSMDSQTLDSSNIGRNTPYAYHQYKIVFTPPSASPLLTLTFVCDSGYFYGAELLIDDITLAPYTPPCTAAAPDNAICGVQGSITAPDAYTFQITDATTDTSSLENCALSCAQTPLCETFSYEGNRAGDAGSGAGCALFSASPDRLGFVEQSYAYTYYQTECFQCSGAAPGVTVV